MLIERMLNFGAIFCDLGSGDSDADNGTKVPSKIVGKRKHSYYNNTFTNS